MSKNKGCCGCFGIGCGGILVIILLIGLFSFKLISPIYNNVKPFVQDEVCVKIVKTITSEGELNSSKMMILNNWLEQRGYNVENIDFENQILTISGPNGYVLAVDGWQYNLQVNNNNVIENGRFNISLTKNGKTYSISSKDISKYFR